LEAGAALAPQPTPQTASTQTEQKPDPIGQPRSQTGNDPVFDDMAKRLEAALKPLNTPKSGDS